MTHTLCHQESALLPWRQGMCFSLYRKQEAAPAAVFPPALLLLKMAGLFKVSNGSLYGTAGQLQICGYGSNRGITGTILICPIFQIAVDHHRTVRNILRIKRR